jgi:hypothetical protein
MRSLQKVPVTNRAFRVNPLSARTSGARVARISIELADLASSLLASMARPTRDPPATPFRPVWPSQGRRPRLDNPYWLHCSQRQSGVSEVDISISASFIEQRRQKCISRYWMIAVYPGRLEIPGRILQSRPSL